MDSQEEDLPLGVPVMKPVAKDARMSTGQRPREAKTNSSHLTPDDGRHPDDELGLVKQLPIGAHAPTDQELNAIQAGGELEAQRLYAQTMRERLGRFAVWGRRVEASVCIVGLGLAVLVALFAFAQTVQILAALALLPVAIRILGYLSLLALLSVLVYFAVRLVFVYRQFRVNQQISVAQLKELSRRAELRSLVHQDKAAAKKHLESYLQSYPLDEGANMVRPSSFQLDDDTIRRLRGERNYLLDRDRFSDYDRWLKDFETRFQGILQTSADKVVKNWMTLVGLKTAISPNALVDSIVVLYCSYGLIADLCTVYNVRMTRAGLIRMLTLSLLNTYTAGQLEEHLDSLSETATSMFVDTAAAGITGAAGKYLAPKLADGAANALLLRKLGRVSIAMLRPVDP